MQDHLLMQKNREQNLIFNWKIIDWDYFDELLWKMGTNIYEQVRNDDTILSSLKNYSVLGLISYDFQEEVIDKPIRAYGNRLKRIE